MRGAAHEGLRPVGEQRLAGQRRRRGARGRRQQQHAPAAEREPDQKRQAEQDPRRPIKFLIDRYQSLPSFQAALSREPEIHNHRTSSQAIWQRSKANEMALTDAQKRARKSFHVNKCGVKGPKAAHGSNRVLLGKTGTHAGLSAPERMRRA